MADSAFPAGGNNNNAANAAPQSSSPTDPQRNSSTSTNNNNNSNRAIGEGPAIIERFFDMIAEMRGKDPEKMPVDFSIKYQNGECALSLPTRLPAILAPLFTRHLS